jgi:hypothetical protein
LSQNKLFFDHIPKTAGTSLQQFFVEAFGEGMVTPTLRGLKYHHALSVYGNYRVITGHFHFIPGENLPENYISATVLRDPRERTLSEYFYVINDVPETGCGPEERRIKAMSLEEALYDPDFSERLRNYQAVHFASFFHPTPNKLSPSELLELAKKGLEQYDLVGVTERLGEFVEVIKRVFDVQEDVRLKRYNVTSKRMRFSELPGRLQERILELTSVDLELWHYANGLFDTKTRHFVPSNPSVHDSEASSCPEPPLPVTSVMDDGSLELLSVTMSGLLRPQQPVILPGELATLRVSFRALKDIDDLTVGYSIHHDSGLHLFGINTRLLGKRLAVKGGGEYHVDFVFSMNLGLGRYFVNISAHSGQTHLERCYLWRGKVCYFDVDGFADTLFEGLVRLMPSSFAGVLGSKGALECEEVREGVQKIGMNTPPISNCKGFIRAVSRPESITSRPGEQLAVSAEVMNQADEVWITEGNKPVYLSYHWRDENGGIVFFDGFRTPLPCKEIPPGHLVQATVMVEVPKEPGDFILELTLVQEGVTWFEERGFVMERLRVKVTSDQK